MDRTALYGVLDRFLAALAARDAGAVDWAPDAQFSENNVMLTPGDGFGTRCWALANINCALPTRAPDRSAISARSSRRSRIWLHPAFGRQRGGPDYRMRNVHRAAKRFGHQIRKPAILGQTHSWIGVEAPVDRAEMVRLSNGYFDTLQLNDGTIHTRFHPECNRVENGVQTTRNPDFAKIVPVSALGCEEQFRMGNYRYDDELRARRFRWWMKNAASCWPLVSSTIRASWTAIN
jgi:hypothetical protein